MEAKALAPSEITRATPPPPPGAMPQKDMAIGNASGRTGSSDSSSDVIEDAEAAEVVIFQIKECFMYKIPPRKSAASHRADDWSINKWAWEGAMRVITKGDMCVIRLEDSKTGELFAQAPIWPDQPLPVEAVIDSSRFFVLRIEDSSGAPKGRAQGPQPDRHAFIGIGFRERPSAYDFQAAVYDHVKYLNKKKEAEEMDKEFQSRPAADYSLKAGQTLKLDIKRPSKVGVNALSRLKLSDQILSPSTPGAVPVPGRALSPGLVPAPPPPGSFPAFFPPVPNPVRTVGSPGPASTAATGTGTGLVAGTDAAGAVAPTTTLLRQTSGEHDVSSRLSPGEQEDVGESGERKECQGEGESKDQQEESRQENGASDEVSAGDDGTEEDDFGDFQAA